MKFKCLSISLLLGIYSTSFSAMTTVAELAKKKADKKSISLYMPWAGISGGVLDTMGLHPHQRVALHGAIHQPPSFFGLQWDTSVVKFEGLTDSFTPASILKGIAVRDSLRALNPNIILIGEVRVYDADTNYLPKNSPYWIKDGSSPKRNPGWPAYYLLNIYDKAWQQAAGRKCKALLETEVVDGCKLDWATDLQEALFKEIRATVGEAAILVGNINHNVGSIEKVLPLLNGAYMECVWWGKEGEGMFHPVSGEAYYWERVKNTIQIAEAKLREPKFIGTEIWSHSKDTVLLPDRTLPESQLKLLRAGTALHYALSNGYVSFFPQPFFKKGGLPEHIHVYHPFFNASLGTPGKIDSANGGKVLMREWSNGTVVYNAPGGTSYNATFTEMRRSQKTGAVAMAHTVPAYDGDIFLKGTYKQVYPLDGTNFPFEYSKPDTTYKGTATTSLFRMKSKSRMSQATQARKQNGLVFKFQAVGESARYYNSQGIEIHLPKGYAE